MSAMCAADRVAAPAAAAPRRQLLARSRPRLAAALTSSASTKVAPRLCTCSRAAGRTSNAETTRAEAARGGDGLEPGDAGAEDEHLAGAMVPAAVVSIGRNCGERAGAEQHGLVAGDGGLRGEHVHRLRAGDARDQLHARAR